MKSQNSKLLFSFFLSLAFFLSAAGAARAMPFFYGHVRTESGTWLPLPGQPNPIVKYYWRSCIERGNCHMTRLGEVCDGQCKDWDTGEKNAQWYTKESCCQPGQFLNGDCNQYNNHCIDNLYQSNCIKCRTRNGEEECWDIPESECTLKLRPWFDANLPLWGEVISCGLLDGVQYFYGVSDANYPGVFNPNTRENGITFQWGNGFDNTSWFAPQLGDIIYTPPTPTPTLSPTPVPTGAPACQNLYSSSSSPQLGDSITLTCEKNASYVGSVTYDFLLIKKDSKASADPVPTPTPFITSSANAITTYTFPANQYGYYLFMCRVCSGAFCTDWQR